MAVTRLGQVTAETGSPNEFVKLSPFSVFLNDSNPRSGAYCWDCGSSGGAGTGISFPLQSGIRANFASNANMNIEGALFRLHSAETGNDALRLRWNGDDLIVIAAGVTVHTADIVTSPYTPGEWNDIGVFYQSGATGIASIYINGELFYTHSGVLPEDLDYFVTHHRDALFAGFTGALLDDLYVDGLTSDEPDSIPSIKIFLPSLPSNQSTVQFTPVGDTPNYRCIDEIGEPDGNTTYVKTLETGPQDLYSLTPVVPPSDYKIRAVIPTAIAKKGDTALDATLRLLVFDGSILSKSTDQPVRLSYAPVWARFDMMPNGQEWEESELESYTYGFEATGIF